ncbi:glycine betaine ABC transporter substrate-binding protein [Myxacorys almedinensis]|uniref:ABC transporter substrate-binding protein n=1 Tax=Myxacorys almedinensis A TaxID=2690445 RepID=A0A8J8CLQ6_9CYAN|nr:glycine betaine ABC transporter substrate-binding protein [Myxacorys almedinensis]NDJ16382.1 ABC transporter substrate-binding protein [Myxacorys almedinensis A]
MNVKRLIIWFLVAVGLASAIAACQPTQDKIVIGTKNFTEQIILGEILAQQIESNTKLQVDRKFNLGGTFVCHNGIVNGQIDLYPEYSGTAYTTVLKLPVITDPQQVFEKTKEEYMRRFNLEWTTPFGFSNGFAMVIRGEDARQYNLKTLSQAAAQTPKWTAGFGFEFLNREDGFPGLAKTYSLKFAQAPKVLDLGLLYRALQDKQVDFVGGNTTDGLLSSQDLVVLEDDKRYFPPYQASAVVRQDVFQKHANLRPILDQLGGTLSEAKMRELNFRVDGKKEDVKQVVKEFLSAS